jgi:hypothetical protein
VGMCFFNLINHIPFTAAKNSAFWPYAWRAKSFGRGNLRQIVLPACSEISYRAEL